jgi:putative protease
MINYSNKIILPELLAPAGDWEALKAGIAAGADAVYLGGKVFSARQYAQNFERKQLKEAADLLHLHGKKIYVTVNTLIGNAEMEEALDFLIELYNFGVDAVIIQDLGLIQLARRYIPSLELYASTQLTVHNLEGALFLKNLGVKRVILARELSRDEIKTIVCKSGMEIEIFIHGALCICYSGQCLMSSMIGGRSGNRGRCAQPCRMEYQLIKSGTVADAEGPYLLSPKDLSLITLIPELIRSGVKSLKIEGRMKRPEYVYHVLKTYRRALDRYAAMPDRFTVSPEEIQELEQAFNRGFTSGYFGGNRNQQLIGFLRPNNRGVYLGRIMAADHDRKRATVKLEAALEPGDEVEVWVSKGGRIAGPINYLEANGRKIPSAGPGTAVSFEIRGKVFPGDRIFKVFSLRSSTEARNALAADNLALKIPCEIKVEGALGSQLMVTYYDNQGNHGSAASNIPLQLAKTRPLTVEFLFEQLGRLGDTPYHLATIHSELPDDLMLPVSELNGIRRRAIAALTSSRLQKYWREPVAVKTPFPSFTNPQNSTPKNPKAVLLGVWVSDLTGVITAANNGADFIYAGGDEFSFGATGFHWDQHRFREAIHQTHQAGSRLIIGLPRIHREGQRAVWENQLKEAFLMDADGVMVSDLGALQFAVIEGSQPIYLNYTLNIFNEYSISGLQERTGGKLQQVTLSPELTLEQIRGFYSTGGHGGKPRLECLIHGPLELMISEYCPLDANLIKSGSCDRICEKGRFDLRDRLNLDFPIFCDQYCRMHLFNSKDLCMIEGLEALLKIVPDVLRLELKIYSATEVGYFTRNYKTVIEAITSHSRGMDQNGLAQMRAEFMKHTGRGITKGHYFRGV